MIDVKGRWAFITGAARGIGYGAALFMAKRGCNLILQGRTKEHCSRVLSEVKALGAKAYAVGAEFSDTEQVMKMLEEIDALGVDVDIVLNNAGIQVAYRTEYLNTPAGDYEQSFKINTIAPMMITYHFLKKMDKRGFGRIVNTTSGIRLEPEQAGYSASKAALDKVTMDLASKYNGLVPHRPRRTSCAECAGKLAAGSCGGRLHRRQALRQEFRSRIFPRADARGGSGKGGEGDTGLYRLHRLIRRNYERI